MNDHDPNNDQAKAKAQPAGDDILLMNNSDGPITTPPTSVNASDLTQDFSLDVNATRDFVTDTNKGATEKGPSSQTSNQASKPSLPKMIGDYEVSRVLVRGGMGSFTRTKTRLRKRRKLGACWSIWLAVELPFKRARTNLDRI